MMAEKCRKEVWCMFATLVNMVAVVFGALVGLFLKKGLPSGARTLVMEVLGLCTIVIGMKMAVTAENDVIVVLSLAIGGLIGFALKLDHHMEQLGVNLKKRVGSQNNDFVEGFVSASLITCVGAMAIVGSFEAGINGNYSVIFVKSVLDMFLAVVLASTYGEGVVFAGLTILIYQGALTLMSGFLAPILTPDVIAYIGASGGVLIIAIGLTVSGIKEFKTINMLPGIFIAPILAQIANLF